MALPNDSLSQVNIKYSWAGRDQLDPEDLIDYEEGGIALNDISQGSLYQLWTFTAVDKDVFVEAPNTSERIWLFSTPNTITKIRATFDQNMNYFVAYESQQQWRYKWFDTVQSQFITSDLPSDVDSCVCTLDDKRQLEAPSSDILLFYTRDGNLYHRRQRDRYNTEILLKESVSGKLIRVGMNGIRRLQIKLQVVR